MLLIFGVIFASAILVAFLIYQFKYKYLIEVTSPIPSPPALPIVGHGHYFIGKPPEMVLQKMYEICEEFGDTVKIWLGPELNIFFNDAKDVEVILNSMTHNDKASEYKTLEPWLKEGLLVSRGRKWHQRRKVITPAFHFKILDQFIDIFEKGSRILVTNLEMARTDKKNENGIILYDWINLCTLDTICGELNIFRSADIFLVVFDFDMSLKKVQ